MDKRGCVDILANRKQGALYVGVTSDLPGRIHRHRHELVDGFTKDHSIKRLVWFEVHDRIEPAIRREKAIKKWHRGWKIALIEHENPDWDDLAVTILKLPPLTCHPRESGDPSPNASGDGSSLSRG